MERLFYLRAAKIAEKTGATAAFDRLNKRFTVSNMIALGAQYCNQAHGFTPGDVRQDEEGLQTMRTPGQNMARLLRCIEDGKKAGIKKARL